MDKKKTLEDYRNDVLGLPYDDDSYRDRIRREGNMIIRNLFGVGSEYLVDFNMISFSSGFAMTGMEANNRKYWESGKQKIINLIDTMIKELSMFGESNNDNQYLDLKGTEKSLKVFIVHGHDHEVKLEVARFIEKIGFEAIILHEQASRSKTIIEKIESYSDVGFGVVLYTPCDVGAKCTDKDNLQGRARQNVVFEHGFLIGKLGRENVCSLVKGSVEHPNDISGIVYTSMDNSNWELELAKELKNANYPVDMNKVI